MSDGLSRAVLDALYPEGSIWNVEQDGDLDNLLEAMGENDDFVADVMKFLGNIRDPLTVHIDLLPDLEKEYGIVTDTRLSETVRRMQLAVLVYQVDNNGSKDDLQTALNNAGFIVQVHENSPAVDPDIFLNSVPFMVAGGDNAYAGFVPSGGGASTAIAGKTGGDLLVNGNIFEQVPDYTAVANNMYAGNTEGFAGAFTDYRQDKIFYPIPDDPNSWPFFFFVGGDATRDGSGALTVIDTVDIPLEQRTVFERIILKYKPIHSWAGIIVNYT